MSPFFTVIIPTFNRESTLDRAIMSVKNQSFKNFELIVVDDASTDGSSKILNDLGVDFIKNEKNLGVSKSRNLAAQKAHGEYLAFLDSDDEWLESKLQEQFDMINQTQTKLVHTEEIWIRDGVRVNQMKKHQKGGGDQFKRACELCVISPSSVAIEKKCFFDLGMFNESYLVCEDYDLWLKFTSLYECEYISSPQVIKYGGHEDQLSRKFKAMDYYRIKSLDHVLKTRKLELGKKEFAKKILLTKAKNLIKGYKKHNNLENLSEIENIESFWLKA